MGRKLYRLRDVGNTGAAANNLDVLSLLSYDTRREVSFVMINPPTVLYPANTMLLSDATSTHLYVTEYGGAPVLSTGIWVIELATGAINFWDLPVVAEPISSYGMCIVDNDLYFYGWTDTTLPSLRRFDIPTRELREIIPVGGVRGYGLEYDGDTFWTTDDVLDRFERRSRNDFTTLIETISYVPPLNADVDFGILRFDARTGYLWCFSTNYAGDMDISIFDPVSRIFVERFDWPDTQWAQQMPAIDNFGLALPERVAMHAIEGKQTGNIKIPYTLYDVDGGLFNITKAEYATLISEPNNWSAFANATMAPGGSGNTNLPGSGVGTQHTWMWNSTADIGAVDKKCKIKLTFQGV